MRLSNHWAEILQITSSTRPFPCPTLRKELQALEINENREKVDNKVPMHRALQVFLFQCSDTKRNLASAHELKNGTRLSGWFTGNVFTSKTPEYFSFSAELNPKDHTAEDHAPRERLNGNPAQDDGFFSDNVV